jgi:hypothetical protein
MARSQRECKMTQSICHQALRHESYGNIQGHSMRDFQEPVRWDHGLFRIATEETELDNCVTNRELGHAFSESFHTARSLLSWNER